MDKPNIILTGFMGTGKTTVGTRLAQQMDYDFVDTDELIEAREGCRIADIFKDRGEAAFRALEAEVARELAARQGLVIATGGRLMLDTGNAAALGRSGRVFCLVATPEEIVARVSKDHEHRRPLLEVPNPIERVVELMHQRQDGYGQFPQMVTSQKNPDEVTQILSGLFQADPDLRLSITARDRRYEFIVGGGVLPFVRQLASIGGPVALITDTVVAELYANSCGPVDALVAVPTGVAHKSLATVEAVFAQLVDAGFDRQGTIVALGGAMISELAGFVAATYMRGVDCVQCPTSLLAMVDTSIGGKAAVDLPSGKNLMGTFKQPKAVIADIATLQTLPRRAFIAGLAEVIKHALIADPELLERVETVDWSQDENRRSSGRGILQTLVGQAIQVKVGLIQEDPFDQGRRMLLNLGHTFAHAIEQVGGAGINHGEAVAMGLAAAADLSRRLGHCPAAVPQRVEAVLGAVGLPTRIPGHIRPAQVSDAMRSDKKRRAGRQRFILLRAIGEVCVSDSVPMTALEQTLAAVSAAG